MGTNGLRQPDGRLTKDWFLTMVIISNWSATYKTRVEKGTFEKQVKDLYNLLTAGEL